MRTFSSLVFVALIGCTPGGHSGQDILLDITFIADGTPQPVPLNIRGDDGTDSNVGSTGGDPISVPRKDMTLTFGEPGTSAGNVGNLPPIVTIGDLHYIANPFGVSVTPSSARTDADTALTDTATPPADTGVPADNGTVTATVNGSLLATGAWTCEDETVFDGEIPHETADVTYPDASTIVFTHFGIGSLTIVDSHMVYPNDGTREVIGDFTTRNGELPILATIGIFYSDGVTENDNYYCWAGQLADKPG